MSDVSLIDGHIDGAKQESCKGCTERHYNCHSECDRYKRNKANARKKAVEASTKRTANKQIERYEASAFYRRAKFAKDGGHRNDKDSY